MTNPVKLIYKHFTQSAETPILQGKIFHRVCGVILVASALALIVNAFLQIPYLSLMILFGFISMLAIFYNSRVLGHLRTSVSVFAIILHLILIVNFFINSALEGPSMILFLVSLIFILAVMPKRQYPVWVSLNIAVAVALISLEYFYPSLIENRYHSRIDAYLNVVFAYTLGVVCISIVLTYLLRSYQQERKKTLVALKEAAEANMSKTKLLSILSHDLKGPLDTIEGFLDILLQYELEEEERKNIKMKLLKETKNTKNMLINLLCWTKSQMDGGIQVNVEAVNLVEVLKVPIDLQQMAAQEKNIEMRTEIDSKLHVLADAEMLRLVVRNLLNNAVKFTPSGGEIVIQGISKNGKAILYVRDNGMGIPEDKQERLFRLSSGTTYGTANEKGVGLGLKLCKEFTELQNGQLSFKSVSGQGTEFQITLPLI